MVIIPGWVHNTRYMCNTQYVIRSTSAPPGINRIVSSSSALTAARLQAPAVAHALPLRAAMRHRVCAT